MTANEYAQTVASDRAPENRLRARVDGDGYVVWLEQLASDEASDFMSFIERADSHQLIDHRDIVMPVGWELLEDGTAVRSTYAAPTMEKVA